MLSSRLCTDDRRADTSSCVASPNSPAAKRLARSSSALIVPPRPTAFIATFMMRGSPMTRDTRGSLIRRIARPSTASLTESSIDIFRLCHAGTLASTRAARHASRVLARAGTVSKFVAGTFLFGWLLGLAIVLKLWHLAHAPRWMLVSGVGYVSL